VDVRSRFLLWSLLLLSIAIGEAAAQTSPANDKPNGEQRSIAHSPDLDLWANLSGRVDTTKIKVGDSVTALVGRSANFGKCNVIEGSLLLGKVVQLTPWSEESKKTELAVEFMANCTDGDNIPLPLIAAAYAVKDPQSTAEIMAAMPAGLGPGAPSRSSAQISGGVPTEGEAHEKFPSLHPGQVVGLRHVSIAMGAGPRSTTILSSSDKRMRLEPETRLAFYLQEK
jgi:hypothetical protein